MYIKINKKRLEIQELKTFKDRFKSLRFNFGKIDKAIKIPNKRVINTVFFVQRFDLVITNKNEVILYLEEAVKSERYFLHKKGGRNFYFLPLGSVKDLQVGDILMNYKK